MFKSSIAVSALLAGGLMFSGCSDIAEEIVLNQTDIYSYCTYRTTTSNTIRDICIATSSKPTLESAYTNVSCVDNLSYSECTNRDTLAAPTKNAPVNSITTSMHLSDEATNIAVCTSEEVSFVNYYVSDTFVNMQTCILSADNSLELSKDVKPSAPSSELETFVLNNNETSLIIAK